MNGEYDYMVRLKENSEDFLHEDDFIQIKGVYTPHLLKIRYRTYPTETCIPKTPKEKFKKMKNKKVNNQSVEENFKFHSVKSDNESWLHNRFRSLFDEYEQRCEVKKPETDDEWLELLFSERDKMVQEENQKFRRLLFRFKNGENPPHKYFEVSSTENKRWKSLLFQYKNFCDQSNKTELRLVS